MDHWELRCQGLIGGVSSFPDLLSPPYISYHKQFLRLVLVQEPRPEKAFDGVPAVVQDRARGLVGLHRQCHARILLTHLTYTRTVPDEKGKMQPSMQSMWITLITDITSIISHGSVGREKKQGNTTKYA